MEKEFTPITTQDDFDAAIKGRLTQQERSIRAEYKDYETLKGQVAGFAATEQGYKDQIAALEGERNAANASLAKIRCARKYGINIDDASRLQGTTEEEIDADAKAWADSLRSRRTSVPGTSHDGGDNKGAATKAEALKALRELRGGN